MDIKNAWTRSVVDAVIGKNLETVTDRELDGAFKSVRSKIDDLLEACQLNAQPQGENQFVLKITLPDGTTLKRTLNKSAKTTSNLNANDIESVANQLLNVLSND